MGDDFARLESEYGDDPVAYEKEITTCAMSAFRTMFGASTSDPARVVAPAWGKEPHIWGGGRVLAQPRGDEEG